MRVRRIYHDPKRQKEHTKHFNELRNHVFKGGGRSLALKTIENHPGKRIADAITAIHYKMDILDDDFRSLILSVENFWNGAFAQSTKHSTYCTLQREVWRTSFHVSASAQSVSETINAMMQSYARRLKSKGAKKYDFWVLGYETKWQELVDSPIYTFNHCLRGALYHARLINADWAGYRDFETNKQKERFLIDQDTLLDITNREPKATRYVKNHSITVRGGRRRKGDQTFGLDHVAHFQRYRAKLRKLKRWTVNQLEDPNFGVQNGLAPHSLEEYLDFERATCGTSRPWKRCRKCGDWFH